MLKTPEILTPREKEILILIATEYSNKEIGRHLGISVGTVESHRKNIFFKMNARNMAGLVHRAYQLGILSTDQNNPTQD